MSPGFYLVPGHQELELVGEADPANLNRVVASVAEAVDVVLVDTGAGLGHETLVAAGLADGVLLVTTPLEAAVDDVARTAEFVDHADASVLGAVVTRVDGRTDLGAVADALGERVLGAIPADDRVGTDPVTAGPAGEAYRSLAATLLAQSPGLDEGVSAPASVDWTPVESAGEATETPVDSLIQRGLSSFGD
jgi:septum site-determining protein MinD